MSTGAPVAATGISRKAQAMPVTAIISFSVSARSAVTSPELPDRQRGRRRERDAEGEGERDIARGTHRCRQTGEHCTAHGITTFKERYSQYSRMRLQIDVKKKVLQQKA